MTEEDWDARTVELCRILDTLPLDAADAEEADCDRLSGLLVDRDDELFLIEGLRFVGGDAVSVDEERIAALQSFDEILKGDLWKTLVLGSERRLRSIWVIPKRRCEMWWWTSGVDFAPEALLSIQTAASLIHIFPGLQEELNRYLEAEKLLSAGMEAPQVGAPISIRQYLRERFASAAPEPISGYLRAAAKTAAEERVLLETDEVDLSVSESHLLVDRKLPEASGEGPIAAVYASGLPPLVGVSSVKGRFEFDLKSPHFESTRCVLQVRLKDKTVEIAFPLEGR